MDRVVGLGKVDAFEPEVIDAMSVAIERVCGSLHVPQSALGARGLIARRVMELARHGERDAIRLSDAVLGELKRRFEELPHD